MADEIVKTVEEAVAKVEETPAAAEVKKVTKKTTKKVEAVAAQAKGAVAPKNGDDALVNELKATMKDVAEQVEKLPVTQKVIEAAKDVAEGVEKNPMAAKVIERVKTTAGEVDKSPLAAQVRKAVKDTAAEIEKSPLLAAAHRVLLAGIGAAALAQDEIEDFVNRLVERGQIAEADGKKMLKDVLEKRKTVFDKTAELAEMPKRAVDDVEKRIEDTMAKMNIPTKDEIEALGAKITALTKKVDELKKNA